jgi:peptidoglycan/LPS O-acetylase OafA/YrhL
MGAAVKQHDRFAGLDALRGLSALGVLFWHYGAHFGVTPLAAWFSPFYTAGLYLVDVFFVLSGFLLGTLYSEPSIWRAYLFKRITRLFPLHLMTLIVVAILQHGYTQVTGAGFIYIFNDFRHFFLNLGLMQFVGFQKGFSFNGPAWSISVEWLVNLVFILLLWLPRLRGALSTSLVVVSASFLWFWGGRVIESSPLWSWLDPALMRGVFGFFTGVGLAGIMPSKPTLSRLWDGIGLTAGVALIVFMNSRDLQQMKGLDFAVVGLVVPAMIAGFIHGDTLVKVSQWRGLVWLGGVSFSVYLWHFPIQIFMGLIVASGTEIPFTSTWVLGAFVVTCYVVGHLSLVFLEKPAQKAAAESRAGQWFLRKG